MRRIKTNARPILETDITESIRDLLRALGIWHWKHNPGPFGRQEGIADILGCYQGRMLAIEVKRPGGRVTDAQARFLSNVHGQGGIAIIARSVEDVIDGLGLQDRVIC